MIKDFLKTSPCPLLEWVCRSDASRPAFAWSCCLWAFSFRILQTGTLLISLSCFGSTQPDMTRVRAFGDSPCFLGKASDAVRNEGSDECFRSRDLLFYLIYFTPFLHLFWLEARKDWVWLKSIRLVQTTTSNGPTFSIVWATISTPLPQRKSLCQTKNSSFCIELAFTFMVLFTLELLLQTNLI